MRQISFDPTAALDAARKEVALCQRQLDQGSSPDFWLRRLDRAAKQLEAAAVILRMQIAAIQAKQDPHPVSR